MAKRQDQATIASATTNVAMARPTGEDAPEPMTPADANQAVTREVSSWDGVSVHEHRFGGVEFRVGRRELGHLHPTFADLPFPKGIRNELVATGWARPHHILPDSGWVTVPTRTTAEVAGVIALFRQNYERATNMSTNIIGENNEVG